MARPAKKTHRVWVALEDDGEPLLWTAAFQRRTCQAYLDDTLSEVVDRRIERATLTLDSNPRRRP